MMQLDYKNYRAPRRTSTSNNITITVALVALITLLAWMGERDHQVRLEQIERKSAMVCK